MNLPAAILFWFNFSIVFPEKSASEKTVEAISISCRFG